MKDTITLPRSVVEQALAAMQSFVSKCDTGLARSKNSYWDFKAVLPDLQAALDAPESNNDDEWCHCGKIECSYCHATAKRPQPPVLTEAQAAHGIKEGS